MSALLVLSHCLAADMFVAADSSLSWLAAWLTEERPVAIMPPNARQRPTFRKQRRVRALRQRL